MSELSHQKTTKKKTVRLTENRLPTSDVRAKAATCSSEDELKSRFPDHHKAAKGRGILGDIKKNLGWPTNSQEKLLSVPWEEICTACRESDNYQDFREKYPRLYRAAQAQGIRKKICGIFGWIHRAVKAYSEEDLVQAASVCFSMEDLKKKDKGVYNAIRRRGLESSISEKCGWNTKGPSKETPRATVSQPAKTTVAAASAASIDKAASTKENQRKKQDRESPTVSRGEESAVRRNPITEEARRKIALCQTKDELLRHYPELYAEVHRMGILGLVFRGT
jgi:hypothetical protein